MYRYRRDDGLPGSEGGFHLMTSWLVDAYLAHRTAATTPRSLFDGLVSPARARPACSPRSTTRRTDRALGNHPQAYTHLGLINTALDLDGQD